MTELAPFFPRTREDLSVDVVHGKGAVIATIDELDHLAIRCEAPVTARGPWVLSRLTHEPDGMPWAVLVRGPYGDLRAAALLVDSLGPLGATTTLLSGGESHRAGVPAIDEPAMRALAGALSGELAARARTGVVALGPLTSQHGAATLAAALPGSAVIAADPVPILHRGESTQAEDYLSPGLRRTVRKARNRLRSDGATTRVAFTSSGAEILGLVPAMAATHQGRDRAHGIEGAMDDERGAHQWQDRVLGLLMAGGLEVVTLHIGGELAAYVIGIRDGRSYRVFEGCFVTRWARYAPGRLLETAVVQRMLDDRHFSTLDWMTGIAPGSILATNGVEPAVVVTCGPAAY